MTYQVLTEDHTVQEIYHLLFRLGGTLSLHGYYYTAYAALLCVQQPERLLMITKWLYPMVAKAHHTNWKTVERNIRTFVSVVWKTNPGLLSDMAQRTLERKPTPKQFLAIVSTSVLQSRTG